MKLFPALVLVLAMLPGTIPVAAARAQSSAQLTPSLNGHVVIPVLVHNKKGKLVRNLTAKNFTLTDNTHPQTIQSFAPNTSLPLTVGIVEQTGTGTGAWLADERRSGETFLTHLMTGTRIQSFLIQFNRDIDLLEDPSPSIAKLHQAFHQLGMPQFKGDSNGIAAAAPHSDKKRHLTPAGGAALYDAVYLASSQVLHSEPGRKVLIVFSDGIDLGSKSTLNSAINAAQTAGVVVYAVYFKDAPSSKEDRKIDGKNNLAELCNRTGGELFDSRHTSLDSLLAQIADQLNHAYILQYTRTAASDDSGFHHIVLKPKQRNLFVQITKGYWLPQD